MRCHKYVEHLACAVILHPENVVFGAVGCEVESELGQGNTGFGPYAVDVESDVVIVGVEVLLHGVQFDRDELVRGVSVGGGVREAQKLAVAVFGKVQGRSDHESEAFAGGGVVDAVDVDEEGSVEGSDFSVDVIVPELEGLREEDSAGVVRESDIAGGVGRNLEGSVVDRCRIDDEECLEVGSAEGTVDVVHCILNLYLGSRRREEK